MWSFLSMRCWRLQINKLWKELFICLSVTLTAHGLLLGYVPWCHVIDVKSMYLVPFTAEAVVSRFYDTGNVSVHVWNATKRHYYYNMLQETLLETPQATGRLEVVRLRKKLFVSELSVLGVSTEAVETMRAEFDEDGAVYVSDVCLLWADTNMIAESEHQFLDLALPYTLPIYLCTNYDCRESITELLDNEEELRRLKMSRRELLELITATTLQPYSETINVTDTATHNVGWTNSVTPMNVTATMPEAYFSTKPVDSTTSWTPDNLTASLVTGNNSTREITSLNGSQTDLTVTASAIWSFDTTSANASYTADIAVTNQSYHGSTEFGDFSTTTQEWRTLTLDGNAKNKTSTGSDDDDFWFPLLSKFFGNNSVAEQSLLEHLINRQKDEMIRQPDDGTLPEHASPLSAEDKSGSRYQTVVGLVIWNVVVTMLLFTVIVALFLVCINNRRSRFNFADSYAVTTDNELRTRKPA